jgi:hypothetical protein
MEYGEPKPRERRLAPRKMVWPDLLYPVEAYTHDVEVTAAGSCGQLVRLETMGCGDGPPVAGAREWATGHVGHWGVHWTTPTLCTT